MRTFSAFFAVAMFVQSSLAQLSGIKNIPGDYATLGDAISALNSNGVGTGGVTLNLLAGNPQTSPAGGYVLGGTGSAILTTSSASKRIIVQGNGNTITAPNPQPAGNLTDGIFKIIGGDYITVSGFTLQENPLNTITSSSSNNMTEFGVALFYVLHTDGAQNNTIQNCSIILNRVYQNTFGVYSNVRHTATSISTAADISGPSGANSDLHIRNNAIANVNMGVVVVGSREAANMDNGLEITGNTITNFGSTEVFSSYTSVNSSVNGLCLNNQLNILISNNSLVSSNGGVTSPTTLRGIFIHSTGTLAGAGSFIRTIRNNTVALVHGNTAGTIQGIRNENDNTTVSISLEIKNNTFAATRFITTASGPITLISNSTNFQQTLLDSNLIANLTFNTTGSATCLAASENSVTISNNIITNISGDGSVVPILLSGSGTKIIYSNRISTVTSNSVTSSLSGMVVTPSTSGIYNIYNNIIADLNAPLANNADAIRGINCSSGASNSTLNVSFNTIVLSGSSSGTTFGTTGIYHTSVNSTTNAVLNLRNNIVINTSIGNGSGKNVAYRRSSSVLTNYGSVSNNNLFYVGASGSSNLIYSDGTNDAQTLSQYKALTGLGSRDQNSISENPNFLSSLGSDPTFLHINPSIPTQINGGGVPVSGIENDFDGDLRNTLNPDIGADEFTPDSGAPHVSGVLISNTTLSTDEDENGTDDYVKNGDNVTVTAIITDDNPLTASNITANLSSFYGGGAGHSADHPVTFLGGVATWNVNAINCSPTDGLISVNITATDVASTVGSGNDDIIADNTPPNPPMDFSAYTTFASGHGKVNLSWTVGSEAHYKGLVARYNVWTYPAFDPAGEPPYPATRFEGTQVGGTAIPSTSMIHVIAQRGIYKYAAFSVDWAGNYSSAVSDHQRDKSANYFLGDLGSGDGTYLPGTGGYDGEVSFDDLAWFSGLYFSTSSSWNGTNHGHEADFGPTLPNKTYEAYNSLAVPSPDGQIEFEDLMIFAMNYENTSPKITVPSDRQTARQFAVELLKSRTGEMLTVVVRVANDGREIKGVATTLNFDPSTLQFVDVVPGGLFGSDHQGLVLGKAEGNKVQIDGAVLGTDRTIDFSGTLAVARFRIVGNGGDVTIDNAIVRNGDNGEEQPVLNNNARPLPTVFSLAQNYPNPFNPTTRIDYQVPSMTQVTVEVYNLIGEKLATLVNEVKDQGYYSVVWDGRNTSNQQVASGLYFYTMRAGDFKAVKKMLLLK